MKKLLMVALFVIGTSGAALAQAAKPADAAAKPAVAAVAPGEAKLEESPDAKKAANKAPPSTGFGAVVFGSGWLGVDQVRA